MGGKSQPDYGDVAAAQGEENREVVRDQLYANRPDQYTPWGYTKWTQEMGEDGTERWSQTQGLTPEAQSQLDKQLAIMGGKADIAGGMMGRMQDEFGAPMDWAGLSPMGGVTNTQLTMPEELQRGLGDPNQMRARAEQSIYDKGASRLGGQFDQKRNALEIKLRNQGLNPQDEAYRTQMQGLGQQETDAYGQLQMDAVTGGRGEQAQEWGQGLQAGQFYNQAGGQAFGQNLAANQQNFGQGVQQSNQANQIRQQQLTEQMQQRGFSLNEINALLSGGQVNAPQMPNFAQGAAAQPAPIYQGAVDAGNQEAMGTQGLYSGLGSIAGAGLGAMMMG